MAGQSPLTVTACCIVRLRSGFFWNRGVNREVANITAEHFAVAADALKCESGLFSNSAGRGVVGVHADFNPLCAARKGKICHDPHSSCHESPSAYPRGRHVAQRHVMGSMDAHINLA